MLPFPDLINSDQKSSVLDLNL